MSDDLSASLGADHMQPVKKMPCGECHLSDLDRCDICGAIQDPQPVPAPREISRLEVAAFLVDAGLRARTLSDGEVLIADKVARYAIRQLETRAPQTSLEREVQDLRRQMRWMHTSCEPDNCHTSGENCTGGARWTPEDFAPQTAPRNPYKRGQLLP